MPTQYHLEFPGGQREIDEAEDRGYCVPELVGDDGSRRQIIFWDPVRLAQDLEEEVKLGRPYLAEKHMVVLPNVTLEAMELSVAELARDGLFEESRPPQTLSAHEHLEQIRLKPAMYLGHRSLIRLASYLTGYLGARYDAGVDDPLAKDLLSFGRWLARRFEIRSSHGWAGIVYFMAGHCDMTGFKNFWELWDEYQALPEEERETDDG